MRFYTSGQLPQSGKGSPFLTREKPVGCSRPRWNITLFQKHQQLYPQAESIPSSPLPSGPGAYLVSNSFCAASAGKLQDTYTSSLGCGWKFLQSPFTPQCQAHGGVSVRLWVHEKPAAGSEHFSVNSSQDPESPMLQVLQTFKSFLPTCYCVPGAGLGT